MPRSLVARAGRVGSVRGFTLVELLVVIGIIALLIAMLMPTLTAARKQAAGVKCLANIRSQLQAIQIYANDNNGLLVCGSHQRLLYPGQPPYEPIDSLASFQIWLGLNQEAPGLGLLVEQNLLPAESLFCPADAGAEWKEQAELLRSRASTIAWGSYLYRQLDGQAGPTPRNKLASLGNNAQGRRLTALILDMQCTMVWEGLPLKRNHDGVLACIGFTDGSAIAVPNKDQLLTLMGDTSAVEQRLDEILEYADTLGPQ
jgi:prepilin-type N-terminal cleavage/methylation domain-containing protein